MFLEECQRLSCLSQDLRPQTSGGSSSSSLQIPRELTLGLTAKKKHEITTLLAVVKEMLNLTGSKHILDIGSGKVCEVYFYQLCTIDSHTSVMFSNPNRELK